MEGWSRERENYVHRFEREGGQGISKTRIFGVFGFQHFGKGIVDCILPFQSHESLCFCTLFRLELSFLRLSPG